MLFARRRPEPLQRRLLVALWPRRSFARSARYAGWRIVRLAGSPHRLARGVAAGVLVATLPLPGAQMILAAGLAWLIGGRVPAALLATFWANPLTLPVLWYVSHWLGETILHGGPTTDVADVLVRLGEVGGTLAAANSTSIGQVYALLWPVLKPLALGASLLGIATAIVFYGLTLHLVGAYRAGCAVAPRRATTGALDLHDAPALPLAAPSRG